MSMVLKTERSEQVEILLSTYNGETYLDAFLNSLLNQDYSDWILTVRDDGSSDRTRDILVEWAKRYPEKIVIYEPNIVKNLQVARSYSELMRQSSRPYVMFADQDDIWLPDKVRITLEAMRQRESEVGSCRPILVHTDLTVVDKDLRVLGRSAWRIQGCRVSNPTFASMMVENVVTGCTMMLNRPLVELSGTIPAAAVYHDWWLALVAAAFGDVIPVRRSTILYRRHGSNETGLLNIFQVYWSALSDRRTLRGKAGAYFIEERGPRVSAFLERYRDRLSPDQIRAAEALLGLLRRNPLSRRIEIVRHGLFFGAPMKNVGLIALI